MFTIRPAWVASFGGCSGLSPVNIFNTDAACPAPTSFSIAGTQQRISYEPMCDTARKARP
ncbi:virulence factor TspB C-terminal domain-related protein, partial [Eikenella longinqua]|uniref:virulence factor TspB C-terminal domain-related protein n=1 Tax=Eikenella longinqua TaxID=1795827 RepID=UPI003CCC3F76